MPVYLPSSGGGGATTQPQRSSDWTIILGDSNARGDDDPAAVPNQAGSWFSCLCKMSGGRVQYMRNAGIWSETTSQMLARIGTDVIAYSPGWCILAVCSPNDSNFINNLATSKSNIVTMVAALDAAKIRPILCTGLPATNTTWNTYVNTMSGWTAAYAARNGIPLLDLHTPVTDPTTGQWVAAYTSDGVHLTTAGRVAVADYNLARIPTDYGWGPYLTTGLTDAGNLVTNGAFITDSNADGLADGWTILSGTATLLLTPMTADEGFGNWQVAALTSTNTIFLGQTISTGFAVGDVLEFAGRFQCDANTNVHAELVAEPADTAFGSPITIWMSAVRGVNVWQGRATVPSGATSVRVRIAAGGYNPGGRIAWAQVTVRNLTALGVA